MLNDKFHILARSIYCTIFVNFLSFCLIFLRNKFLKNVNIFHSFRSSSDSIVVTLFPNICEPRGTAMPSSHKIQVICRSLISFSNLRCFLAAPQHSCINPITWAVSYATYHLFTYPMRRICKVHQASCKVHPASVGTGSPFSAALRFLKSRDVKDDQNQPGCNVSNM